MHSIRRDNMRHVTGAEECAARLPHAASMHAYPSKLRITHDLLDDIFRGHVDLLELLLPAAGICIPFQGLQHLGIKGPLHNTVSHADMTHGQMSMPVYGM